MTRRLRLLVTVGAVLLPLVVSGAPAAAIDYVPFVTVDVAPDGAKVAAGEHFAAIEFSNSRPLRQGAVGPLPVFYADDEFGCVWTTAINSGISDWIGLARRSVTTGSDPCGPFAQKLVVAQAAGADALILINNAPGAAAGTAAGTIPGGIIDQEQGTRLKESLSPSNPNAVTISFGLLDPVTFLPPELAPFLSIDVAPEGAKVLAGERFEAIEFSNSRPLVDGAVGPLPVFYADDEFGCVWTTAISSGITEWIALARRSVSTGADPCSAFQQKLTAATAAGADALVLINNAPGTAAGTAAGVIPGGIIDQAQGTRLKESLSPSNPNAVQVTLGLLEIGS